jgi:hypothetical protein
MAEAQGQFGKPEEGECQPLEAVTKSLVKTLNEDTSVCLTVICTVQSQFVLKVFNTFNYQF